MRKWLFLFLGNLFAGLALLFFLDYFGLLRTYSKIKERVFLENTEEVSFTVEEAFLDLKLMEEEQRKKLNLALDEKEQLLQEKEKNIRQEQDRLKEEKKILADERESLLKKKQELSFEESKKNAYKNKVTDLANRLYNMPPKSSSERILALKDDLLIIDVLKSMDEVAKKKNQQSIVPFLMSLMPPDQAARILKKTTVSL